MIGFNNNSGNFNQTRNSSSAKFAGGGSFGFGKGFSNNANSNFGKMKTDFDMGISEDLPEGDARPLYQVAKIGDYVNYNVEPWKEEEIEKLISLGLYSKIPCKPDSFEGFKPGDSKNDSVKLHRHTLKNGWRIIGIFEPTKGEVFVIIVHAGFSEMFFLGLDPNSISQAIAKRDWSEYVNPQYAIGAKALTKDDLEFCIYLQNAMKLKKEVPLQALNLYDKVDSLEGLNCLDVPYCLCERFANSQDEVYILNREGRISLESTNANESLGIRVVVALKANIKITGREKDGAWKLAPQ